MRGGTNAIANRVLTVCELERDLTFPFADGSRDYRRLALPDEATLEGLNRMLQLIHLVFSGSVAGGRGVPCQTW